ncbi:MAG: flagellar basal body L-ring protein FlgH [Alcaligenes faecalis]|jgi:flagellar L-ring protein precursor FlgH|uniref:Flagellar L-ring protein n=1 Tax=Alcaligenes aquatilis TaxID=323284 RepID=A0ABY4NJ96_9BURK|nr:MULTISPECIES: flagellar basal body L-ring protein FlgH [Alcaligenes]AWG33940.1 flagellar basal body L-ring protein [Alcaligenes aquatilis]MCC9163286.1 flagellar basal body L-ring protein FlgH [Alcaligenes sp. MMA]MCH4224889.1 flagellar basal body L-ring protein FlgH [Alcaligenes faecalis]QXR37114.1 flagellar basal body L-ring protein FlgH [Alcaligenes aquatilis]UQN37125.1 flagellar basal body L-ring protein FlgH [Alcaligenes aquatilis]
MFQALLSRLALGALVVLSGCALVPPEDVVTGPLTAAPPPAVPAAVVANGSIYQPSAYGNYPLFEDRRPRNVGDIVTIMIQERTNAAKNVSTNTDRTGSGGLDFTGVPAFLPNEIGSKQNFEVSGSNKAQGKGSSRADNTFTGTLTTTVVGVLPNGNLQVAGEKQIAINRGSEYIRFSGVVDPRSISGSSTVPSTQVADARIEFRSKGVMDEVQTMGWLQRFFLNISPF